MSASRSSARDFDGAVYPDFFELVDEGPESLLGVLRVDCIIERPPVGLLDPLALGLGQLGVWVARAADTAALAVRGGPALLDRFDQLGAAVGVRTPPFASRWANTWD